MRAMVGSPLQPVVPGHGRVLLGKLLRMRWLNALLLPPEINQLEATEWVPHALWAGCRWCVLHKWAGATKYSLTYMQLSNAAPGWAFVSGFDVLIFMTFHMLRAFSQMQCLHACLTGRGAGHGVCVWPLGWWGRRQLRQCQQQQWRSWKSSGAQVNIPE